MLYWNPQQATEQENVRWAMLRALEWSRWPLFVFQPIIPIVLPFIKWQILIPSVILLNLIWGLFFRYSFVNFHLAELGVFFVRLKWLTCPAMAIYFYINGEITNALIAFFWPLITIVLAFISLPANLELLQSKFLLKIGFLPEYDQED